MMNAILFFLETSAETIESTLQSGIEAGTDAAHTPPEFNQLLIKTILLVGALLALTFTALWVLKRIGGGRFEVSQRSSLIRVIERKSITPKCSLWIVEIEEERYVVAESANNISITPLNSKAVDVS